MAEYLPSAASIISASKGKEEGEKDGMSVEHMLHQCMEDFHRAAHAESPNYAGMASAFRAANEILHAHREEGEGDGDE